MPTPDFLIIGAMKSGTTTLYRDMLRHPGVFMPIDKEPHALCSDSVLTPRGREGYASLFRDARPGQKRGEASTGYTKRPMHERVVDRSIEVCGPDLRLIYIVRDPVERALSHHYHEVAMGDGPPDFTEAIERNPGIIEFSRYAWQLEPWIERFGKDNILVLIFEEYVQDRRSGVSAAWRHIGLEPPGDFTLAGDGHNRGETRVRLNGLGGAIQANPIYRRLIRPASSPELRDRVKRLFGRPVPPRPEKPPPTVLAEIRDRLAPDAEKLSRFLQRPHNIWDLPVAENAHTH